MNQLTGIELRKAIAESLGWTHIYTYDGENLNGMAPGDSFYDVRNCSPSGVPHYETSLDACWKFTKLFDEKTFSAFTELLKSGATKKEVAVWICQKYIEIRKVDQ